MSTQDAERATAQGDDYLRARADPKLRAALLVDVWWHASGISISEADAEMLAEDVAALCAQVRAETLEQAAVVAEEFRQIRVKEAERRLAEWGGRGTEANLSHARDCELIAATIRALDVFVAHTAEAQPPSAALDGPGAGDIRE